MSDARASADEIRVPRPALYAAGVMIAFTIFAAIAGQSGFVDRVAVPDAPVVETRTLRFHQREDGGVIVFDVDAGRVIDELQQAEAGFVNGVLRGLSYHRRVQSAPADAPYRVIRTAADRLALVDTWTKLRVELRGFGADNDAAFARWLTVGNETR